MKTWLRSEASDWWLYGITTMITVGGLAGWIILAADQARL